MPNQIKEEITKSACLTQKRFNSNRNVNEREISYAKSPTNKETKCEFQ
jgi:hypothetical protein